MSQSGGRTDVVVSWNQSNIPGHWHTPTSLLTTSQCCGVRQNSIHIYTVASEGAFGSKTSSRWWVDTVGSVVVYWQGLTSTVN